MSVMRGRMPVTFLMVCLFIALFATVWPMHGTALQLTERNLFISSSQPGASAVHTFNFTYPSTEAVGSIVFEYCTSPLPQVACEAPVGLDMSNVALTDQTGETGFSVVEASTSRVVLARQPITTTPTQASYEFANAQNPTTGRTFFARVTTHQTTDGTGASIDFGAMANTIMPRVQISGEVPPILNFCVGITIDITDGCTSAAGSSINFGVLGPTTTARGTSQMLANTNALFGLAITVHGRTMTSGNHEISAMETPGASSPGQAQFGMNLRANTIPLVGQEPAGAGIALPAADYNAPNQYVFRSGDVVAVSPAATDTRHFTVSYIANVPPDQHPGVYSATITFIGTATF